LALREVATKQGDADVKQNDEVLFRSAL
jgi:hypothetical protein